MNDYPQIISKIFNTPLLAHPDKAAIIANVVLRRAGVEVNTEVNVSLGPMQEDKMRERRRSWVGHDHPFLFADGIAGIEIVGTLAHRQMTIGKSSGITGYDGIGAQLDAALESDDVKVILLDFHSPGGEVSGAFQLADRIFLGRQIKPIYAVVDEIAFSGAYVLAAAATEIWMVSDTAQVGSVGVVMVHMSFERMLQEEGIKPTLIHAGARKVDGNPFEDLSAEDVKRFQADVDYTYDLFVSRVAMFRGITDQAVRDTEAATFFGENAVAAKLADGVSSWDDIYSALVTLAGETLPGFRGLT